MIEIGEALQAHLAELQAATGRCHGAELVHE